MGDSTSFPHPPTPPFFIPTSSKNTTRRHSERHNSPGQRDATAYFVDPHEEHAMIFSSSPDEFLNVSARPPHSRFASSRVIPFADSNPPFDDLDDAFNDRSDVKGKGKATLDAIESSDPIYEISPDARMAIPSASTSYSASHSPPNDLIGIPSSSSPQSSLASFSFSPSSYQTDWTSPRSDPAEDFHLDLDINFSMDIPIGLGFGMGVTSVDKGKAKAPADEVETEPELNEPSAPPVLPEFSFPDFSNDWVQGRDPQAGPSSLPADSTITVVHHSPHSSPTSSRPVRLPPVGSRPASRRQSFSNYSTRSARSSLASRSMLTIKRKLRKTRRDGSLSSSEWSKVFSPPPGPLDADKDAVVVKLKPPKPKPRAYSSPLPYPSSSLSPPSLVSVTTTTPPPPNRFDDILPYEVQVMVFSALIGVREEEHAKDVECGRWTAARSRRERWVGKEKGLKELVKFSRVSKHWQALTLDGQLWSNLSLAPFPNLPKTLLLRLVRSSGPFIRHLDLRGHTRLGAVTLHALTFSLTLPPLPVIPISSLPETQLTSIDLRGCAALTTQSMHNLLRRSPYLAKLLLRGSHCVTNTTLALLATHCPRLRILDVGRCHNIDALGVADFLEGPVKTALTELRVAGLKHVDVDLLETLARKAPNLEVLDISGAKDLTDAAFRTFTAWSEDDEEITTHNVSIKLSSREMGLDPHDPAKYFKRVTQLRHINVSSCPLLTDMTPGHLSYCVPKLELFEMGGIGANVRDEGLVRLFVTTPLIRRIDLEDASEITDNVLSVLTPVQRTISDTSRREETPSAQPGEKLEAIVLSLAVNVTSDGVMALVKACTKLRRLEVDSTRVHGTVVKEFVQLSRERRARGAEIVAVDCRNVSESTVKEIAVTGASRPRRGFRHWDARPFGYEDARDSKSGAGDECDEERVIVKSFWAWQSISPLAVLARDSKDSHTDWEGDLDGVVESPRSGRRWFGRKSSSGSGSPTLSANGDDDRGCVIM